MRLYLSTSPPGTKLPFAHHAALTGALHRWLGPDNEEHDTLSLYSFSWLQGGVASQDGLDFPQGANFFISFYQRDPIARLVQSILSDPILAYDMRITGVDIRETPVFTGQHYFQVASPVFIKRDRHDGQDRHILYTDEEADACLTETLQHKLSAAGLPSDGVTVRFDRHYSGAKTQLVQYKGIHNKASFCPVIITGTPEHVAFAWCVGVGNSTGIGFGSLK